MKIKVRVVTDPLKTIEVETKGEEIIFGYICYYHRKVNSDETISKTLWTLTEYTTGASISHGETRKKCLNNFLQRNMKPDFFITSVKKTLERIKTLEGKSL